jgi:hypothetical protein
MEDEHQTILHSRHVPRMFQCARKVLGCTIQASRTGLQLERVERVRTAELSPSRSARVRKTWSRTV